MAGFINPIAKHAIVYILILKQNREVPSPEVDLLTGNWIAVVGGSRNARNIRSIRKHAGVCERGNVLDIYFPKYFGR